MSQKIKVCTEHPEIGNHIHNGDLVEMVEDNVSEVEVATFSGVGNDPVIQYGQWKTQVKDLEEKMAFLKPVVLPIIQQMKEANDDPEAPVVVPDLGSYNIQVRTTYEYSDEIKEKEKALKKLKANEVREGVAIVKEENTILVFTTPKE